MSKRLDFTNVGTHMANKHLERFLILLAIKEMQIKITIRYCYMTSIKLIMTIPNTEEHLVRSSIYCW